MVVGRFQNLEVHSNVPASGWAEPKQAQERVDWMDQALRHRRRGRFEEALRDYSRAVGDRPALRAGWLGQAQMLIALGEYSEAELWTAKALELFRDDGDLTAAGAQARARLGETARAQSAADAAVRLSGESPYRWLVRAELLLVARNPLAGHCLRKLLALRDDWLSRIQIGEVCLHCRHAATALDHLQQAVRGEPGEPYGWLLLGQCQRALNLKSAARDSLSTCHELDAFDPRPRIALESLARASWRGRLWRLFT